MKNTYYLLTSFVFILLAASLEAKSTENLQNTTPVSNILQQGSTNDISILLDQNTQLNLRAIRDQNIDGKSYLVFLNEVRNSLYRYDLTMPGNFEKISFDKEGPFGIGKLTGFDISGTDTFRLTGKDIGKHLKALISNTHYV